jgi:hypothetical protein
LLHEVPLPAGRVLHVRTVETLHVTPVECGRPRSDRFQLRPELLQQAILQNTGVSGGLVGVVLEDIPGAEHEILEAGKRYEVAYGGRAMFGALPESNRTELGQRSDGSGETFSNGINAGDERRAHRAKTNEQHTEFSARGGDVNGGMSHGCSP